MSVIDQLVQQPVAQAIGWALLQFVWQGAVLGVLTALLLTALRRSAPDIRYVVSSIALALMATLPLVTALQAGRTDTTRGARSGAAVVQVSSADAAAASRRTSNRGPDTSRDGSGPARAATPEPVQAAAAQPAPWLALFAAAWICGVALLSLRLASGWLWVQGLTRRRTSPVADRWQHAVRILARQLHIRRPIRILESAAVAVPTVIGWLRPVVLMPASALAGLSPEQVQAILAHELAHIRRHDYLVNLLQTLVETMLFYHPAVWWLSNRIRAEREHCCDDLAVSLCGDPMTYARALADLEGLRSPSVHLALAASGGSLLVRVRRLVRPSHAGRAPGWAAGVAAVLLITGVAAGAIGNELQQPDRRVAIASERADRQVRGVRAEAAAAATEVRAAARAARQATKALSVSAQQTLRSFRETVRLTSRALATAIRATRADVGTSLRSNPLAPSVRPVRPSRPTRAATATRAETPSAPSRPESPAAESRAEASPEPPSRPAAPEAPASPAAPARRQTSVSSSGSSRQHGTVSISNDGEKLEVMFDGEFEFTDDDADLRTLTPYGVVRITDGGWFTRNTVEFRADAAGTIERHYRLSNTERPFDPDGRRWLARVLPPFIRQSGIGARARVARILKQGGPQAVLKEITLIQGAFGKRAYFNELMKAVTLDAPTRLAVLTQAGREIDSDFELATFLIENGERLVSDDAARRAYLDAARRIGSDFELRRVLSAAVDKAPLPPALLGGLLDASTSIESDFEEATLLVQVAQRSTFDASARDAFFRALDTVDSDFEHRRVLTALAERSDLADDLLRRMVVSSSAIESDFEQGSFLVQVAGRRSIAAIREPFFKALSMVDSKFERGRVLQAVLKQPDVSQEVLVDIMFSTQEMGSAFEASQVLQAAASQHHLTGRARDLYIDAAGRLGTYEQGQALAALVKSNRR